MQLTVCKAKIHRATVTHAHLDYRGSITIDRELMDAAGILPYELVHVNNMSNAVHWETYVIPGDKGVIKLNGCPARLFAIGDEVIILSLRTITEEERAGLHHVIVNVDKQNSITAIVKEKMNG
jgi:aspartate 1-decarboxylase